MNWQTSSPISAQEFGRLRSLTHTKNPMMTLMGGYWDRASLFSAHIVGLAAHGCPCRCLNTQRLA